MQISQTYSKSEKWDREFRDLRDKRDLRDQRDQRDRTSRQTDKQTSGQVDEGANCIWEACSYLSFCPFVRSS